MRTEPDRTAPGGQQRPRHGRVGGARGLRGPGPGRLLRSRIPGRWGPAPGCPWRVGVWTRRGCAPRSSGAAAGVPRSVWSTGLDWSRRPACCPTSPRACGCWGTTRGFIDLLGDPVRLFGLLDGPGDPPPGDPPRPAPRGCPRALAAEGVRRERRPRRESLAGRVRAAGDPPLLPAPAGRGPDVRALYRRRQGTRDHRLQPPAGGGRRGRGGPSSMAGPSARRPWRPRCGRRSLAGPRPWCAALGLRGLNNLDFILHQGTALAAGAQCPALGHPEPLRGSVRRGLDRASCARLSRGLARVASPP